VAAIVTPTTDAVSLLLMALPLIVLYESSIMLARLAVRAAPAAPRPNP
jgi:Sec-independent protein secretion pathway component TatC